MFKDNVFAGFSLGELIYQSSSSLIYKTASEEKPKKAILKILRKSSSKREMIQFHQELAVSKKVNSLYVVKVFELVRDSKTIGILMEDIDADSLNVWIDKQTLSLIDKLNIALSICKGLQDIHHAGVIHKGISSSNIVWNQKSRTVKIIDFGIASLLSKESISPEVVNRLEGDLFYMSPEQTGRMNRAIDYRTDFYSLGITLYELFTGKRPFYSEDPLQLIHAHIAKLPQSPEKRNAEIPMVLSKVIMKLLQKTPENRYQTAHGIIQDFAEILRQYQDSGAVSDFMIGEKDLNERFVLPTKLYGRSMAVTQLENAFKKVCRGCVVLNLVKGYSGVGKTATVQHLFPAIEAGIIIPKNDRYKRVGITAVNGADVLFIFQHDRVQQAAYLLAYLLIDVKDRASIQQKIGLHLLDYATKKMDVEQQLFEIANHLNQSTSLVKNKSDRLNAAEIDSPALLAELRILLSMWLAAYLVSRESIAQWCSIKMANMTLKFGNSEFSSLAFVQSIVEAWFYSAKIRSLFLLRALDQAMLIMHKADAVLEGGPAQIKVPEAFLYSCLVITATFNRLESNTEKQAYLARFERYQLAFERWSKYSPDNFLHKWLLIRAEAYWLYDLGLNETLSLYDSAFEEAKKAGYLNMAALAQELKGRFWLHKNQFQYGLIHLFETAKIPFSQVLANLISNAIKHHPKKGGVIRLGMREQGHLYEFFVADDGAGIAPRHHKKIFGMFQTLKSKDSTGNTGIGLSIVKKIVESQGGSIRVQSEKGCGATFYFTWPICPPKDNCEIEQRSKS